MTHLPTVYPSSIARAISALDELPIFKSLPDGYLRIVVRLIKKIDVRNPRKPIVAARTTLAEEADRSLETVQRCVRWLENEGLIERNQKAYKGLRGSSSPITPTQALLDALLLSVEAKAQLGMAKHIAPARPKSAKLEFIKIDGRSVPAELAWMCVEGKMHPTLLYKLMHISKITNTRLADVVMAARNYLDGLTGKHLFSYVKKLLVKGGNYSERAEKERSDIKAAEIKEVAQTLIGKVFKNTKNGCVYLVKAVNTVLAFRSEKPDMELIDERFYEAVNDGRIIPSTLTTQQKALV